MIRHTATQSVGTMTILWLIMIDIMMPKLACRLKWPFFLQSTLSSTFPWDGSVTISPSPLGLNHRYQHLIFFWWVSHAFQNSLVTLHKLSQKQAPFSSKLHGYSYFLCKILGNRLIWSEPCLVNAGARQQNQEFSINWIWAPALLTDTGVDQERLLENLMIK